MDVTDNNSDVSTKSDESIGNIFENLVSELVDYREALCNLVIVPEDNTETSHFNSSPADDAISPDGSKIEKKPANGKKDCSDLSINSDTVRDNFSVDNKIKISDLSIRDFQPGNSKNSPKKVLIPNATTVVGTPNKLSNFGSEAPINISAKEDNATLDCNSQTSTTDFTFLDSDSNIAASYLKISEKYLGASSFRIFTEESLRRSISQYLSQADLRNCNAETAKSPTNYSQRSTEVSTSTDDDGCNPKLGLKSSQDPEIGLDYIFSVSNPNQLGILNASDRNSESSNCGLNISNRDSEICHSFLSFSDGDQVGKPGEESPDVLSRKIQNLVNTINEFQDASAKVFDGIITEFSNMAPTFDNDRETSFSSDTQMGKGIPAKTTNTEEKHGAHYSTNADNQYDRVEPLVYFEDQNATAEIENISEKVIITEEFSNMKLTSDNDIESSVSLHKVKGNDATADSIIADDQRDWIEPLVYFEDPNATAEFQNTSEDVITAEEISNMELSLHKNLGTSLSSNETKGNAISGYLKDTRDECDRLEALICSINPSATAVFQGTDQEVINTEAPSYKLQQVIKNLQESAHSGNVSDDRNYPTLSQMDQKSKLDRQTPDVLEVLQSPRNQMKISSKSQGVIQKRDTTVDVGCKMKPILSTEQIKSVDLQGTIKSIETSVSLNKKKGNDATADYMNADDQCDWLEPLVYFEDPSTTVEFQNTSEDSGYLKYTKEECDWIKARMRSSDSNVTAVLQGMDQEVINADAVRYKFLQAIKNLPELAHSVNVSDDCNKSTLSKTDQESKPDRQTPDVLEALQNPRNQMKVSSKSQGVIQKLDTTVDVGCKMKPILSTEQIKSVDPQGTIKSEMSSNLENTDHLRTQTADHSDASLPDSAIENYFSGRGANPSKTQNISNGDKPPPPFEEERRQIAKMNSSLRINNNPDVTIDCVETKDKDADTLDEIFKRVIKCHPIKKFIIPPYASANAERTLGKSVDPFKKDACSVIEPSVVDGHRNILEVISDTDSSSIMVFDVTDSFSQNCNIICDGLINEYLYISAKVDLTLTTRVNDLSVEQCELRMSTSDSLHDELGYINAKFISKMNQWVKQFREIEENIEQSSSRDLYHMGILEICLELVCILINFCNEKQLNLEKYEDTLMLQYNRYN